MSSRVRLTSNSVHRSGFLRNRVAERQPIKRWFSFSILGGLGLLIFSLDFLQFSIHNYKLNQLLIRRRATNTLGQVITRQRSALPSCRRVPVGKSLPNNATKGVSGSCIVVYPQFNPIVIPKVELRKVPVKVALAAVLVHPSHASLKQTEEAFHRIRGYVAAHVFLQTVLNGFVGSEFSADAAIIVRPIGHQSAFASDVLTYDWSNRANGQILNMEGTGVAVTLN